MSGLASKCMLIDLTISRWDGSKTDREASSKLTESVNAETGAANVTKRLVPREALAPIATAYNAIRQHVMRHTLPWTDNGQRIMTRNMYALFLSRYGELERDYYTAVDGFLTVAYPQARDQASFRMGDLFKENDYPSADDLRKKFGVSLDITGITEPDDFRVKLPDEELAKVKASIEDKIKSRLDAAMRDVWRRLTDVLAHYVERIGEPDAKFREATVTNLVELVNILPGLNAVGDPTMREIRQRLLTVLGSVTAPDLRNNADTRAACAQEAQEILKLIKEYVGADNE